MTTTVATISQIEVLTPRTTVRASFPKPGLSKRTRRFPFVTSAAQPLTMNDIASVVISALMRRRVVDEPVREADQEPGADPERDRDRGRRVLSAKCAEVTPAKA